MALFRFKVGTEVEMDDQVWRFVDPVEIEGRKGWFLKRLSDGEAKTFTERKLKTLFDGRQLRRHYTEADGTVAQREAARRSRAFDKDDLPEADRFRRAARAEFLRRVSDRVGARGKHTSAKVGPDGETVTLLGKVLAEVSEEMKDQLKLRPTLKRPTPSVSQATYYRWLKLAPDLAEDSRGLEGGFSARGRRNQLHTKVRAVVRETMRRALETQRDKRAVGKVAVVTMAAMKHEIKKGLAVEKHQNPAISKSLEIPSDATLYRIYNEFPAFDRAVAKYGISRARRDFRTIRGHEDPEGAYELVEYDETVMPYHFYDEVHGVSLGKGTLCWTIDGVSHAVGGLHISSNPSAT